MYRILTDKIGKALYRSLYILCNIKGCEVPGINVQPEHVHLVVIVPASGDQIKQAGLHYFKCQADAVSIIASEISDACFYNVLTYFEF